ncbi:MAG: cupin domain-containing protein [Chloroflexi bacterium]|nr:cupin domain-containing protein [Chloroflexota bacterium]
MATEVPLSDPLSYYPLRRRRRRRNFLEALRQSAAASAVPVVDVGQRLRELRNERSLSIRTLAEKSQLNVNTLSMIENGKTSPSVATLQQLAFALETPIAAFFEMSAPQNQIAYQKVGQRPIIAFAHGTLEDLGAGMISREAEPFLVVLEPHAESGPTPIIHTGREFVFCLEGCLAYTIEDQTFLLEPGDSLLFEAHLPHRWQNVGETPTRSLLVLCPSDEHDRPAERHFTPEPA